MTQYAQFNPALSPAPVIGWYDTGALNYPNLPPASDLFAVTPSQWDSRMIGQWAVNNSALVTYTPPTPPPTLAQQAAALIAGGITITSTGTPGLDGVYACDATAQSNLQAVQTYILTNGKFPGSSGTYPWLDTTGAAHVFPSVTEFEAFASRVADFVADCTLIMLTNSGTLPVASANIP